MENSSRKNMLVEIVGWYGAVALLASYALVSFNILTSGDIAYQILNITGALGIIIVSFYDRAYQPGVLNIIWAMIGIIALIKIIL
jgi:hypothetical protein